MVFRLAGHCIHRLRPGRYLRRDDQCVIDQLPDTAAVASEESRACCAQTLLGYKASNYIFTIARSRHARDQIIRRVQRFHLALEDVIEPKAPMIVAMAKALQWGLSQCLERLYEVQR